MSISAYKSFDTAVAAGVTVTKQDLGVYHFVYEETSKDVRPAADFIAAAVQQRREELGPDTKIVVLMGEVHTIPTHIFLQQAVHARLLNADIDFTAAYERPRDWWRQVAPAFDVKICESFGDVRSAHKLDLTGDAAVCHVLHKSAMNYAILSHHALEAFDYYNRIPVRFYDACMKQNGDTMAINMDDSSIGHYRNKYMRENVGGELAENINPVSHSGLELRNIAMARNIDHDPARTIVMHTGAGHIEAGDSGSGLLLTSAIRMVSKDTHVISVIPAYRSGWYTFHEGGDHIVVNGLDKASFEIKKWDNGATPIIRAEINYAKEVQKACGGEISLFLNEFFRKKEIFGPAFARHRQEVIDAYHAQDSGKPQKPAAPSL